MDTCEGDRAGDGAVRHGVAQRDELPLFRVYPVLHNVLPRQVLLEGQTTAHPLRRIGVGGIWIKRDDDTSHIYGGTKVRKLEFLLGKARAEGKSRLVAFGAMGSHHLLATATFARRLGMRCEALVCDQHITDVVRRNLIALHGQSAELSYGGSEIQMGRHFLTRSLRRRKDEYLLFPGGSSPLGTLGLVNAAFELHSQIEAGVVPLPAAIVCALGSGGTVAGLALGTRLAKMNTEVIGVQTHPARIGPIPITMTAVVCLLMKRTYKLLKELNPAIMSIRMRAPRILRTYLGAGYAVPSKAGLWAQRLLAEAEGIELEPTYTAKTFAAVLDLRRSMPIAAPILYWHSHGGKLADVKGPLSNYYDLPAPLHFVFERPPAPAGEYAHG